MDLYRSLSEEQIASHQTHYKFMCSHTCSGTDWRRCGSQSAPNGASDQIRQYFRFYTRQCGWGVFPKTQSQAWLGKLNRQLFALPPQSDLSIQWGVSSIKQVTTNKTVTHDRLFLFLSLCLRWSRPFRCCGSIYWNWRKSMSSVKISATDTSPASRPKCTATTSCGTTLEGLTLRHTPVSTCSRSVTSWSCGSELQGSEQIMFCWWESLSHKQCHHWLHICSLVSLCDPPGTNSDLLSIHDLCLQLC